MASLSRRKGPRPIVIGAAIVAGVLAFGVGGAAFSSALSNRTPPPVSDQVASYAAANSTLAPKVEEIPVTIPADLMNAGTKAVIYGDSWTEGYGAKPQSSGYAYVTGAKLGWDTTVLGSGGTGYVNPGPGNKGTFSQRMTAVDVDESTQIVILQGSINDLQVGLDTYGDAVKATLDQAKVKFPNAQVVILGPAPATLPPPAKLHIIDNSLRAIAKERNLPYISPLSEIWITAPELTRVIDAAAANHPSTQGHAYLADKVIQSLKTIAQ